MKRVKLQHRSPCDAKNVNLIVIRFVHQIFHQNKIQLRIGIRKRNCTRSVYCLYIKLMFIKNLLFYQLKFTVNFLTFLCGRRWLTYIFDNLPIHHIVVYHLHQLPWKVFVVLLSDWKNCFLKLKLMMIKSLNCLVI